MPEARSASQVEVRHSRLSAIRMAALSDGATNPLDKPGAFPICWSRKPRVSSARYARFLNHDETAPKVTISSKRSAMVSSNNTE